MFESLPVKRRRMEELPIKIGQFTPIDHLTGCERIGIIGLPGMGKSCTVRSLLYELQSLYTALQVISGSETDNGFYSALVPKLFIHNRVSSRVLKQLVNRQRLLLAHNSDRLNSHAILILDDVLDSPKVMNNQAISLLYKQGRHLNASVWLVQQYPMDVKPFIRSTTSAVFLFYNASADMRLKLYNNYASGIFKDFAMFDHVFSSITVDKHTAMVILLNRGALEIQKVVFWYKASMEIPEDFRCCSDSVWDHNHKRIDINKAMDVSLMTVNDDEL